MGEVVNFAAARTRAVNARRKVSVVPIHPKEDSFDAFMQAQIRRCEEELERHIKRVREARQALNKEVDDLWREEKAIGVTLGYGGKHHTGGLGD